MKRNQSHKLPMHSESNTQKQLDDSSSQIIIKSKSGKTLPTNTIPNVETISSIKGQYQYKKHKRHKSRQKSLFTDFQSSNTLQNSSILYSFSKSPRFDNDSKAFIPKNHSIVLLPSLSSRRAAGFGYGERGNNNKNTNVSPDTYNVLKIFEREREQKKITMHSKLNQITIKSKNPGPGAYNIANKSLMKDNPIILKSRQLFYYDENIKNKSIVSPQAYYPNKNNALSNRFKVIGMGFGKKYNNELVGIKDNPGPGTYNLPSQFNNKFRSKPPIN